MRYLYPNLPNYLDPSGITKFDRDSNWIAERKKNGWRCLAIRDTELKLFTRRHTIIPDALPRTREALLTLPPGTIIDGELIDKRTKEIKDLYYAFDILFYEGVPLLNKPWKERRGYLEKALAHLHPVEGGNIEISIPVQLGKSLLYETAILDGDEGIVLKHVNSLYLVDYKGCPHNPFWIKVKQPEKHFMTK